MDEILDSSLAEMASAISSRSMTSVALVRGFLDRIERKNPPLNALVYSTAEQAMQLAAKADADLQAGVLHGPLHGIPMTIKDSLDTKDAITTWGTLGRKDFRPGRDATCVARLRSAGGILMGKTNTPEFTLAFKTDNLVYGRTNNPYNLNLTPGGSSGGAAALIAAGATPFDIGTDTGGSIRLPSHFCGITGLKPTTGRVPCTGNALPTSGLLAALSQPGPMARQVADLGYLLDIIQGPDLFDPYSTDAQRYVMGAVDPSQLRIGYHTDNGISTPSAAIQAAIREALGLFEANGQTVTDTRPPGVEMASFIYARLFGADGGDTLDLLLEDSHTEQPSPQIASSQTQARPTIDQSEFNHALNLWDNYRSSMLGYFADFDILICPVNAHTALGHDETEDMLSYSYTLAYNLTGWPAVVIRCGTDPQGLPIGLQIIARPFREDQCLAVAAWLEAALQQQHGRFSRPA
ncbi:amidase [Pseudomonadales bacterium]|nr:amidase [Pseudomonadales bacterium]MDC0175232.1 amidase [Pseudomonadales bacterium]